MSCKYCENLIDNTGAMHSSFDGDALAVIRIGKTMGYPAILAVYSAKGVYSFGIDNCLWCGRDLKAVKR